jgi:predicted signal transduction protein with EAL and GGDEF domain
VNGPSAAGRVAACVIAAFATTAAASAMLLWQRVPHALFGALLGVEGVAFAGVLAGLWAVRRWALRTQAEMLGQIEAAAGGRFEERVQSGAAEWAVLTRSLNVMVVKIAAQIADRDRRLGELHAEVSVDELTGLASRGQFMERLGAVLQETGNGTGGVALLRIDDLAGLNQRTGRERTDTLLKAVAVLLRTRALRLQREGVLVARLNGADFALLAPAVPAGAMDEWAKDLAAGLQTLKQQQLTDRPRVGWIAASGFTRGETLGAVMSRVDRALQASEANNTAWQVMNATRAKAVIPLGQWRNVIDEALTTGRVSLDFVELLRADGSLHHRQALVRIATPDCRLLGHDEIIPSAMRTGRITDIDLRAAELALDLLARQPGGSGIAVKITTLSAQRPAFITRLEQAIEAAGAEATRLLLEVDGNGEPALVATLAPLAAMLRRHGVALGLEQVHALPEELSALHGIGVGFLKLSASVCRGLAAEGAHGKRRLLELLVEIGRSEGVEVMAGVRADAADLRAACALGVSCAPAAEGASEPEDNRAATPAAIS